VPEPKLDTSAAQAYEAVLVPPVFRPWAELMVREAGIGEGARALDVACGTGIVARSAARASGASGRSTGIDIDPAMIEVARATSIREGVQVEYHCAPGTQLPFEPESFDAAFCQQGLQYFPDKRQGLAELRRVMRPTGILVVTTWTEMQDNAGHWAMISALERRHIDAQDLRKPFASSDPVSLRTLAESAGLKAVSVQTVRRPARFPSAKAFVESIAKGAPSSRLALLKVPATEWDDFLADVEARLAPWGGGASIEFFMASNLLTARR
jgi:ubiquinone/menaquinone biosynthesis C-methylase UbiE